MQQTIHIAKVRDFSEPRDYEAFAIVRMHAQAVNSLDSRDEWVRLDSNGHHIYRRLRGASALGAPGLDKTAMELDYDSRLELGIHGDWRSNGFIDCDVQVSRAPARAYLAAHWNHPMPAYRVPLRISLVSLVLGLIGIGMGVASLVL